MSTLVDSSDAGRKASGTQLQRAARRAREARADFWRACIFTTFFVVVIGALLLVGAVVIVGRMDAAAETDKAAASHKTARIKRPLGDTIFCRYTVFDNKSAQLIEDGIERCDVSGRISNDNRKSRFSWGGK